MAEPVAAFVPAPVMGLRLGWTKILMPLLQPVVVLKSATSSKLEKRLRVIMSPPACDSALPLETMVSSPFVMIQLLSGNSPALALRQPAVVLPSQSRRQPSAFSCSVRVLFPALISRRRRLRKQTFSPTFAVALPDRKSTRLNS